VVRAPRLTLALLALVVVLGHLASLEWFARQAEAISGLKLMAPPMYTRMLKPAAPPPVVATIAPAPKPKPRAPAAPKPKPPASSAQEREQEALRREAEQALEAAAKEAQAAATEPLAQDPASGPDQAVAQAPQPGASEPQAAASAPAAVASAPVAVASAPVRAATAAVAAASTPAAAASASATGSAAPDPWPADTRLTYDVTGEYRNPVTGTAHVQWQREGNRYQVRLDVTIRIVVAITQTLTSQGEVTPAGLLPRAYEEARTGGKRRLTQFGDQLVVLDKGVSVPRPPGVQDTASQFVELAQRFATGKDVLEVGRTVRMWLARPGGVDEWIYDVTERQVLSLPLMGDVEAFHLKPRPLVNPRGNITAEMWFAPSLQYLPVKIKVIMGNEAWLDLVVDRIDQR